MSNQRRLVLSFAVKLAVVAGLVLAAVPFIGSLKPSQRADALDAFEKIDVSEFPRNSYQLIQVRDSEQWETGGTHHYRPGRGWLVIRDDQEMFHVFGLPTWDGEVLMPKSYWGQFEGTCVDLGPSQTARIINDFTQIRCNDQDIDQYYSDYWFWSLDGRNVSRELASMEKLRSEVRINDLYILDPWLVFQ